jgi:Uma2 family endonuclease
MASASSRPGNFAEFLAWEQAQERRHEYIDHVAVMMAGGTRAHDRIQRNLLIRATEQLRGSGCEPLGPDMIVETGTGNGRYPDMTIDCGRFDPDALTASAPTAVFEVLSDSTRKTDLLIKLRDYDATPSIRHYVLIAQTEYLVFVYSRAGSGNFSLRPKELRQSGESVELPDLGLSLTLAEIYEGIGLVAGESLRPPA